jgi:hypothetical protein
MEVARSDDSVWSCSFNLTRGKTYRINILASPKWGQDFASARFEEAQPVNVTITSETGGVTRLQTFFLGLLPESPQYKEGTPPTIIDVRYQNVDDANVRVITPNTKIEIIPKQTGVYTIRVLEEGLWSTGPPDYFALIEKYTPDNDFYTVLSFCGGIIGIAGGVTYVASIFRKGKMNPKKIRK